MKSNTACQREHEALFERARGRFESIVDTLGSREGRSMDLSELEKRLKKEGNALMRELLQSHMDLRSLGSVEAPVKAADGVEQKDRHRRERSVETVFGTVEVDRERFHRTGKKGLAPLDAELNLAPQRASLELRRHVARLAAKMSYDDVVDELREVTGAQLAKRQVEELAAAAAADFDAFYEARREAAALDIEPPTPESNDDSLLVVTADGKGIPMRKESLRAATRKAAEKATPKLQKRRTKGEKAHKKRMAQVAAVYTIAPHVRRPEDVVAGLAPADKIPATRRPKPQDKRVWASVATPAEGVLDEMFEDALARHAQRARRWVALVDGNETQLTTILALAEHHQVNLTVIIDVIHVLEYLWKAGMAFEREGSPALEAWVNKRFLLVLQGQAKRVAAGLRRAASRSRLTAKQRKPVDVTADYLNKYADFLRYDDYLAEGLPIATGVIEGACRYLVKDRMEKTGARWHLTGAEAVLRLRSLRASGDFDEYWRFHEQAELRRNHLEHYEDESPPTVTPARKPRTRGTHLRVVK